MKAIHRTVYLNRPWADSGSSTQKNCLLRVHDEAEVMRRIDAQFPTFNKGRE